VNHTRNVNESQQQPTQSQHEPQQSRPSELPAKGVLEVGEKGFGFLRNPARSYQISPNDIYVSPDIIRRYRLRPGLEIEGRAAPPKKGSPQLIEIKTINGQPPEKFTALKKFDDLTVIQPNERLVLETVPDRYTTRVIDIVAPIGKGTRGLIVAAPRTGKTTLLHHMADAVLTNHPDVHTIVLLCDERPEETTDFRRSIKGGEVIASTNDQTIEEHVRTARMAIERAKRLVEFGRDVFLVLDSITRLARAFNNYIGSTGRTMTGGLDARAMEQPRRIFASAKALRLSRVQNLFNAATHPRGGCGPGCPDRFQDRQHVIGGDGVHRLGSQGNGVGFQRRFPLSFVLLIPETRRKVCLSEIKHVHTDDGVRQEMA